MKYTGSTREYETADTSPNLKIWQKTCHFMGPSRLHFTTVPAPLMPHSWIEPHPLRNHAKNNFLCVFYVVIWGQKSILKNKTLGLYWSGYGICLKKSPYKKNGFEMEIRSSPGLYLVVCGKKLPFAIYSLLYEDM